MARRKYARKRKTSRSATVHNRPVWPRRRYYSPSPSLPLAGFPKQKMVRMRYVQEIEIVSPSTGLSNSIPFVANGCYDPFYPIGGHQCKGFDEWMSVYTKYNVLGSKINVKMVGTGQDNFAWGVARTPEPNTLKDKSLPYILEWRGNKSANSYTVVGSENGGYANNPTRMNKTRFAKYSQKKQFGKNSTSNADLVGTDTSNPNNLAIFEIWQCPIQQQLQAKTGDYVVVIDYIVLFTEPKILAQS